jgi:hypothetical protein
MRATILAAPLALALAAPASAACVQADLAGSWALVGSNNGVWTICKVDVADDGTFEGNCTGTKHKRRGSEVAGVLELAEDCSFTGEWEGPNFTQLFHGGQLAPSGEVASGIVAYGEKRKKLGLHFDLVRIEP